MSSLAVIPALFVFTLTTGVILPKSPSGTFQDVSLAQNPACYVETADGTQLTLEGLCGESSRNRNYRGENYPQVNSTPYSPAATVSPTTPPPLGSAQGAVIPPPRVNAGFNRYDDTAEYRD